jgi:hypothetical protein
MLHGAREYVLICGVNYTLTVGNVVLRNRRNCPPARLSLRKSLDSVWRQLVRWQQLPHDGLNEWICGVTLGTPGYLNQGERPAVHGGRESDNCGTTVDSAQSGVSSHVHFHSEWRVYTYRRTLCWFGEADQHVRCDSEVRRGRGVASTPVGRFCRPLEPTHIRAPAKLRRFILYRVP